MAGPEGVHRLGARPRARVVQLPAAVVHALVEQYTVAGEPAAGARDLAATA